MLRSYEGRVAVVAGAASGLGRALAEELAARKCHLALIDIDAAGLAKTAEELGRLGITITSHCADVSGDHAMERVATAVQRAHGAAHLLINNAAISASASFANTSAEAFERIIRVNFFGVVHGCRAFLPLLEKSGQAQILNVASCFAWVGYPGKTAYASSKGAIRSFSESLRLELAARGVGVTILYPGPLATAIIRNGIADSEERRAREEQFLVRRGRNVDSVACRCLDKLLGNPGRIVMSLGYRLLDALVRCSPPIASRIVGWGARRAGF